MKNTTISEDMTIYSNVDISSNLCKDSTSCKSVNRILLSLKYYNLLKPRQLLDNESIFSQFVMNIYKYHIFDDFNHMTHEHGQDIHQIMNIAVKHFNLPFCDLNDCNSSSRHYRVDDNEDNGISPNLLIYYNVLDSIHYYIFHLFQAGFRFPNEQGIESGNESNRKKNGHYDGVFARRVRTVANTRNVTQRFARVSPSLGGKYCIINSKKYEEKETTTIAQNTYLDSIYFHLLRQQVNIKVIAKLRHYLLVEEYDTESVDLDLRLNLANIGNIAIFVGNQECMNAVLSQFDQSRRMCRYTLITQQSSTPQS